MPESAPRTPRNSPDPPTKLTPEERKKLEKWDPRPFGETFDRELGRVKKEGSEPEEPKEQ